ncbi:hypothetical protein [Streptomyces sp. NPDC001744]|uniref:hypothetical protein n=1 Tax=Streptomyces sp. NPDC001744 TaxID=3364606 RepID=UPI0036B1B4F5
MAGAVGPSGPSEARPSSRRPAELLAAGPGFPRPFRSGVSRPGRTARPARWFGTPLVPLLTAALVVTAFLLVGAGAGDGGTVGRDAAAPPSPVVTGDPGPAVPPPTTGARTSGTADAGTTGAPTPGGTPTRTTPGGRSLLTSAAPEPPRRGRTASPATAPATGRTPSGRPASTPPPARPVSFEALRVGDCFDIDRAAPGTAVRRPCDTPHSAELVARPRLTGRYATDRAVREAAAVLCRGPLRVKAARQPLGTRWTTFVQYPYRTSYLLGSDAVACSLAAPAAGGGRIGHRLR